MKYKIGSSGLGLKNCKDKDRVVITTECDYKKVLTDDEEIMYISKACLEKNLYFNSDSRYEIYNYQYDRSIIGNDFPIEYHILDYRNELIELLNTIVKQGLMNFNKLITCNNGNCSKLVYHIAYNIFILWNNSPIITEEQKVIIQKIHDCEMPIEYIDVLKEMLDIINNNTVIL